VRIWILDGKAQLEDVSQNELRALFCALDRDAVKFEANAILLENEAREREDAARKQPRGRVANRRVAGELRQDAAGQRALLREVQDLMRTIRPFATDPSIK
jgi:hypothetical protein